MISDGYELDKARSEDAEQLKEIWMASFGDGEAFVREMLQKTGLGDRAVGARADGLMVSCMFAFDGLRLGELKCSYLYALCTHPEYRGRGLGRAVTAYAARCALERGADAVFLRPADGRLERWYADTLGAIAFARREPRELFPGPAPALPPRSLSPEEYLLRRPASDWELPPELIKAQDCVQRHFGGAFLALGGGALCAEKSCGGVLIREHSLTEGEAAAAAAAHFGGCRIFVPGPSREGGCFMLLPVGKYSLFPLSAPPPPIALD